MKCSWACMRERERERGRERERLVLRKDSCKYLSCTVGQKCTQQLASRRGVAQGVEAG